MATKKRIRTAAEVSVDLQKAKARVLLMAERWANFMESAEVLSSASHHLLRAVQKLERLEQEYKDSTGS